MFRFRCAATRSLVLFLLIGGIGGAAYSAAPAAPVTAEAVYAAFTLNLTRFITWPEGTFISNDAPFIVGTFPRDPINAELDAVMRGQSVGGHPIRTIRLQSLDDVTRCQIVFVSKTLRRHEAVLHRAARRAILTISDADGFLAAGGQVSFVPQPPHIQLRVSAENLKTSGLEASAQLLRLAGSMAAAP